MTAYVASTLMTSISGDLALRANATYPLRVVKIEMFSTTGPTPLYIEHFTGGTMTGGTAITPIPLHQGAPASTATAKANAGFSGGLHESITILTCGSSYSSGTTTISVPATTVYQLPLDFIVTNGNTFLLNAASVQSGQSVGLTIYYEELRLSRAL